MRWHWGKKVVSNEEGRLKVKEGELKVKVLSLQN